MDPFTALGASSAAVQFFDLVAKLLSTTVTIYKGSGDSLASSQDLSTITTDIRSFNDRVLQSTPSLLQSSDPQYGDIRDLCKCCNDVAKELIGALGKIRKRRGTRWDSFRAALATIWSEGEIRSLQGRVDGYRQQISLKILVNIQEVVVDIQDRAKRLKLEEQLERKERRIVNTFNGEIEKLIQNQDQNEATWQRNLGLALHHLDPKTFRNALRNSLYFEQMEERELTIPKAYQKTYEWIFNPSHNKDDCGFVNWLQSDDQNLYWITGKPGSGKSTLMKFIANHPRKKQLLSRWGGSMEVICFSFFFWNSGTDLQMSQEGLLRSIFSDALRANPELAEKVFPNHFERWTFSARIKDTWTWEDLIQSFERLLNELIKTYKIMLFIDGLDEFYGPHYKLIELLKNTIRPNIKICISSRPWNVFQDAFSQGPNLQLEALTGDDIEHYVKSMLISSPAFKDMQVLSPSAAGILVENVTKKASGVFIWVVLVIQSLLEGLQDGERLSNLQSRLDTLPINLEELFMKILRSVDDKHFQRASWYFQIYNKLAEIGDSPEVFFFSFADSLESSIEPGSSISQMNSKELELEASLTKRRLNACTKGLLEVSSVRSLPNYMAHVNFLHRTVRDFINAPEVFSTLLDATENDFDSDARIAQTYTLALKGIDPAVWKDHGRSTAKAQKYLEELIYKGIHFAVKSDPGCQGDQLPLLQGLYRAGQRTVNLVGWSMYWPSCLQSVTRVSLLKLLVVCQLAPCLSHFLQPQPTNDFQGVVSKSELNELLYLAITSFIDSTDVMKLCVFSKSFDLEIISILLNAGANPDSKCLQSNGTIREYALEHYGSESKELMAMLRKSRTHRRSRILKMFRGDP